MRFASCAQNLLILTFRSMCYYYYYDYNVLFFHLSDRMLILSSLLSTQKEKSYGNMERCATGILYGIVIELRFLSLSLICFSRSLPINSVLIVYPHAVVLSLCFLDVPIVDVHFSMRLKHDDGKMPHYSRHARRKKQLSTIKHTWWIYICIRTIDMLNVLLGRSPELQKLPNVVFQLICSFFPHEYCFWIGFFPSLFHKNISFLDFAV